MVVKKRILITFACVISIILVAGFAVYIRTAPLRAIQQSLSILNDETTRRINASPFQAIGLLSDSLENGNIHFDARFDGIPNVRINGALASNANERALDIGVIFMHLFQIELETQMNQERVAGRIGGLGDDFYGFTYSTFRDDIKIFGNSIGLDNEVMNTLSDMVEILDESLNADSQARLLQPYFDVFSRFLLTSSFRATREEDSQLIRFSFDWGDIISLLDRLYALLEQDEALYARYGFFSNFHSSVSLYDQLLEYLYGFIREMEQDISGDAFLTFSIDPDGRLNKMYFYTDIEHVNDGLPVEILLTACFGTGVYCSWKFSITFEGFGTPTSAVSILWDFASDGTYVNTIILPYAQGSRENSFVSEWTPETGDFTLSFGENVVGGRFISTSDDSFHLSINTEANLSLEINATQETPVIPDIHFVNLDMWDTGLIGILESPFFIMLRDALAKL